MIARVYARVNPRAYQFAEPTLSSSRQIEMGSNLEVFSYKTQRHSLPKASGNITSGDSPAINAIFFTNSPDCCTSTLIYTLSAKPMQALLLLWLWLAVFIPC